MSFQYMPPGNVPQVRISPTQLFTAAQRLSGLGGGLETTVTSVNSTWQQLGTVYIAPETTTLTNALAPISRTAQQISTDLVAVSGALESYASTLETVQLGLQAVRAEAMEQQVAIEAYMAEASVAGGNPAVEAMFTEQTEGMVAEINTHLEQWEFAEYECAQAIALAAGTFGSTPQRPTRQGQVRTATGDVATGAPSTGNSSGDVNTFTGAGAASAGGLGGAMGGAMAGRGVTAGAQGLSRSGTQAPAGHGSGTSEITRRLDGEPPARAGSGAQAGRQSWADPRQGTPQGGAPAGANTTNFFDRGRWGGPTTGPGAKPPTNPTSIANPGQPTGGAPTGGGAPPVGPKVPTGGPPPKQSSLSDVLDGNAPPTGVKGASQQPLGQDTSKLLDGWSAPARPAAPVRPLTNADRQQITDYTSHRFEELNRPLRNGTAGPEVRARADALSGALAKFPPHKGTVVRGADLDEASLGRYAQGQTVRERAFTSTTYGRTEFGGNTLFVIKSRTGRDITDHSYRPSEREVLFDKNTDFKVLGKKYDERLGRWVIEMMEV